MLNCLLPHCLLPLHYNQARFEGRIIKGQIKGSSCSCLTSKKENFKRNSFPVTSIDSDLTGGKKHFIVEIIDVLILLQFFMLPLCMGLYLCYIFIPFPYPYARNGFTNIVVVLVAITVSICLYIITEKYEIK